MTTTLISPFFSRVFSLGRRTVDGRTRIFRIEKLIGTTLKCTPGGYFCSWPRRNCILLRTRELSRTTPQFCQQSKIDKFEIKSFPISFQNIKSISRVYFIGSEKCRKFSSDTEKKVFR